MKERGNVIRDDYIHFYSGVGKTVRAKRGVSIATHRKISCRLFAMTQM